VSEWERMKRQFVDPPAEFTPMPFWFWNDELSREEIIRQIHDFHAHEVDGFVLHPRMGLPRAMPYLSDPYFEMVEAAVAEAAKLSMRVILYDEGMYPSGSACGKVVERNPEFASRGLRMEEHPCAADGGDGTLRIPIALSPGESLVSALAVRKLSDTAIEAASALVLESVNGDVSFTPPDADDWSLLLIVDTYSRGTIRGVHPGQDDGEPDAPLAADLLNPEAVQAFIDLTHEAYYRKLSGYFGTTVLAMFTDEPDLLGRGHAAGLKPWTRGFMGEFLAGGGREQDLPLLWFDVVDAPTAHVRDTYEAAVRSRLSRTYYKPLADWCEEHGIGLTGHPAGSDDIGLLEHFHIPGQDVVWRYIAPEDGKSLTGVHSTMGKCSSDAARHRGRRRNLNECFGVCGIDHGWMLSADNMKWYLDWLFVRGVNLISPHAFYYSIRGERRDERPPDVGPNNIWWPEYGRFSRYIKRMSWLMTDSANSAEAAVLARADDLPWRIVKPLYERQVEFNYLEEALLGDACSCKEGVLEIAGYRYSAILIENGERLNASSWRRLEEFSGQGGLVVELTEAGAEAATADIGQARFDRAENVAVALAGIYGRDHAFEPRSDALRISRVAKNGILFYVIVNEGEAGYEGAMHMKQAGRAEYWRPWTGECKAADVDRTGDGQSVAIRIERRECLIVAVDPSDVGADVGRVQASPARTKTAVTAELSEGWRIVDVPRTGGLQADNSQWDGLQADGPQAGRSQKSELPLPALTSWTDWPDMACYSGTVTYENSFRLDDPARWTGIRLDLGEAHELVRLWVNGREAGVRMWSPYVFDLGSELRQGTNLLRVSVTNSLANRYDGKPWPSGLIGPVRLLMQSEQE